MSKYIIDVGEGYIRHGLERTLTIPVRINEHEDHWMDTRISVTPYTEPDIEQIRKEAYDKGYEAGREYCPGQLSCMDATYQKGFRDGTKQCANCEEFKESAKAKAYQQGLADAWDAATKIANIPYGEEEKVFGSGGWKFIINHTASEAIEKIRQYEQEKEEWLRVGDEVEGGDEKYIVLQKYLNNIDELMVVLFNRRNEEIGTWHLYNGNGAIFKKTGRHFPEIAEVLKKMREE